MTEIDKMSYQHGYEAGHHDGLAAGMARATAAYEAGRLAAIRAEVERALEDLADDVESEARESREHMRVALQNMRDHRIGRHLAGYDLGRTIGCWTNWERARRDVAAFLAATRRWLQETA